MPPGHLAPENSRATVSRAQQQRLRKAQDDQGCVRGWCLWKCGRVETERVSHLGWFSHLPADLRRFASHLAPGRCRGHELSLSEPVSSPEMACPLEPTLMAQWWQAWGPEPTMERGWAPPAPGAPARPPEPSPTAGGVRGILAHCFPSGATMASVPAYLLCQLFASTLVK